jgi:hypothetical protein
MQNNHAFFGSVYQQLFQQGGLAAMLYDLLNYTEHVNLRHIPDTEERAEQKQHSLSGRHQWWLEELMSGEIWRTGTEIESNGEGDPCVEVDPLPLYTNYLVAIRAADMRMNAGLMGAVGQFVRKVLPERFPHVVQHDGKRFWVLPSLRECRAHFEALTKIKPEWPIDPTLFSAAVPF